MEALKSRWDITKNWQLIHVILGIVALLFCGFAISKAIIPAENVVLLLCLTVLMSYVILNITLRLFKTLKTRWAVKYRWELIAIFLVFAITGSTSARLSVPFVELIGLDSLIQNKTIFWIVRILIIFPIYQILLIGFGWLFGQFEFFWDFEKKMLRRFGVKI